jgi:1,4-dihydroxy-2-naphthoate octaprenyltransferase
MVAYVPLFLHLRKVIGTTNLENIDPELKKLALTTFLLAVLMGLGHLF